ncbi:hypothetical protein UlMin_032096 [Ulmus minor]
MWKAITSGVNPGRPGPDLSCLGENGPGQVRPGLVLCFSNEIRAEPKSPFRATRKASEAIGAQIVLGDRLIEITLERAWNSLRWIEKRNLVLSVVRGITSPPLDQFQNNVEDNGTFQLYEQLIFSYPSLLDPLIHERDTYLAWSLKRSKSVNRSKGVVGVIGKGHMNGVIYALISDQGNLHFKDLAGGQRPSTNASNGWIRRLLNSLIRDNIIGFLLWELYEQIKRLTLIYNIGLTLLEIKKSFRDVDNVLYDLADSPSSNYCV